MDSKIITAEEAIDQIGEFMVLQTRFNVDIDKRVTKHDMLLLKHEKQIKKLQSASKLTGMAMGALKKYFGKRSK